jgi:hypothetical protein
MPEYAKMGIIFLLGSGAMNYLKPVGKSIQASMLALLAMLWFTSLGAWAGDAASAKSAGSTIASAVVAATPSSNSEIRQWYNDQVASIAAEDKKWQQQGLTPEQRARRAYEIRHGARLKAREFMSSKAEVSMLQARDQEKYGNPDGPTFDYLVEQNRKKGMTGDAVYLAIIDSSDRTNAEVNKAYDSKSSK